MNDDERLEFDADQDAPEGLDITTATATEAEVPRLCGVDEVCRVVDQPKLAPEQAIVATAGAGYVGAAFPLTGQAIDADAHAHHRRLRGL